MNHKGFTLVELIAMMVVIGVLMAITIPNISGIVKKNRESIGVEDVNKMIGNTKTKLETGQAKYPETGKCVVITLNYIDNNNDFKTGVNGGYYNKSESVIVVKKEQIEGARYQYKYYIRLVEKKENNTYIVGLVDYDEYSRNPNYYTPKREQLTSRNTFDMPNATNESANENITRIYGWRLCDEVSALYIK